jgi:hypothetical protein
VKYTRIQRRDYGEFVTIGEYIKERQPNIFQELYYGFQLYVRDVTELILTAASISGRDKQYQYLIQERPKSGRGGLLPGEGEENLYEKL